MIHPMVLTNPNDECLPEPHQLLLIDRLEKEWEKHVGLTYDQSETLQSHPGLTEEDVKGLSWAQLQGFKYGLKRDQVNHDWFCTNHYLALKDGRKYSEIVGLSSTRVGYLIDMPQYSREDLECLNRSQLEGLKNGLTLEQVNHDWFDQGHALAAEKGRKYSEYQGLKSHEARVLAFRKEFSRSDVIGLDDDQLDGLLAGLTRDQVDNDWFGAPHAYAARCEIIPYNEYSNLSKDEVKCVIGIKIPHLDLEQIRAFW